MGMNYYLKFNVCNACGRFDKKHLGKASVGCQFAFQGTFLINTKKGWEDEIKRKGAVIIDEYGEGMSKKEFFEMVEHKQEGRKDYKFEFGEFS